MCHSLISSPLQGYTDFRFRNAFQTFMGGIDVYYAPYIRLNGKKEIKKSTMRDIMPENNSDLTLIPQIMTNSADDFLWVAKQVQELGYNELNWNLGCPHSMVSKRGMGAGLLNDPAKIDGILQHVFAESDIKVSVKMRLGYENKNDIFDVLPVFDKYALQNITIHPRIGTQLYKGTVDLDTFEKCVSLTRHTICYNGDITSLAKFKEMTERFPSIYYWSIGRGLISDPFLPQMIKNNTTDYPENKIEIFKKFHDTLFDEYQQALSGSSHLLMKMVSYWKYFIIAFPNTPKGFKKLKKAKSIKAYENAVHEILANG